MIALILWGCSDNTTSSSKETISTTQEVDKQSKIGPPGPPPNGAKGQGAPMNPVGMGPGMQQKSFHASVQFDWVGSASPSPKSIIWISLDTVHAKRMAVYGGRAKTPNLQKMAENGWIFEEAISHFPETALSHWTMMSSVLPEIHGNVPANGGSIYTGPTMAEIAKHHKYATAGFIGGVTMTDQASGFGRGFDLYDDQFTFKMEDMSRPGVEVTTLTQDWIAKQSGSFFVFAHYFDAHFPYTPSKNLYDPDYKGTIDGTDKVLRPYRDGQKQPSQRDIEHVLALYDAEITELDEKIAPLLQMANDNTIVVVTADHGESFSHDYYFNHRGGLWDEVTHVPLLIAGGGLQHVLVDVQVGLIDVLPTVLDFAGLPKDEKMMGKSYANWENGDKALVETMVSITDPWMPNPQWAVRSEAAKWIVQKEGNEEKKLGYNLKIDPQESHPNASISLNLTQEQKYYQLLLDKWQSYQTQSPRKRKISDEECKRLMALGYTTCDQP